MMIRHVIPLIRHVIPLILCLVTLSSCTAGVAGQTPLQCTECSTTVTKYNGLVGGEPDVKYCALKTCEDGVNECVSGHANIFYVQEGVVTVEIVMDYFKECGGQFSSCDALERVMALKVGDDVKVEGCEMDVCEEDNCNDKTPDEINPDRLKQISCYTCYKGNLNGTAVVNNQPECSEEHKETCTLGIETCYAGTLAVTVEGTKYDTEYFKSCGAGDSTSSGTSYCEAMNRSLQMLGTVEWGKCNVRSCEGDLCNTCAIRGALGSLVATIVLLHIALL